MQKLPVKKYFSFIAGAVDTDVPSLSNISENFREISKKVLMEYWGAGEEMIHEKNLR